MLRWCRCGDEECGSWLLPPAAGWEHRQGSSRAPRITASWKSLWALVEHKQIFRKVIFLFFSFPLLTHCPLFWSKSFTSLIWLETLVLAALNFAVLPLLFPFIFSLFPPLLSWWMGDLNSLTFPLLILGFFGVIKLDHWTLWFSLMLLFEGELLCREVLPEEPGSPCSIPAPQSVVQPVLYLSLLLCSPSSVAGCVPRNLVLCVAAEQGWKSAQTLHYLMLLSAAFGRWENLPASRVFVAVLMSVPNRSVHRDLCIMTVKISW